jgi:putative hydrolase of the HAD superfamily
MDAKTQILNRLYLLLDAGGTLVFPDQDYLIEEARKRAIELTATQLYEGFYRLIYAKDSHARGNGGFPSPPWPQGYAHELFRMLGMVNSETQAISQVADDHHRQLGLWTFTFDWIRTTLSCLASQGFRMSVISNSNGRTNRVLKQLGLRDFFEDVFESYTIGIEKPNPAIFEKALFDLKLQPADALYVGDVFEVDVRGANRAGLRAVHLDPLNLYTDWPGVHLPDIRSLPSWLAQYMANPLGFDLFPCREVNHESAAHPAASANP